MKNRNKLALGKINNRSKELD